jgi:hypothetical protein
MEGSIRNLLWDIIQVYLWKDLGQLQKPKSE